MGQKLYPEATELPLTADCGRSNGYRIRLWKTQLQKLATETGLQIRDQDFRKVKLKKDDFHGKWNYLILPKLIDK